MASQRHEGSVIKNVPDYVPGNKVSGGEVIITAELTVDRAEAEPETSSEGLQTDSEQGILSDEADQD